MDDNDKPHQEVILGPGVQYQIARAVAGAVKWELVQMALICAVGVALVALVFQCGMSWADEAAS